MSWTRREFLVTAGAAVPAASMAQNQATPPPERVAFFLIGDTHFLANSANPKELDATSRTVTTRLVDQLNRLAGTQIPEAAGGGTVQTPRGLIHAGDMIDTGDKTGAAARAMQETEWRAFETQYGLTGRDGRLRYPIYEVHGNHDAPAGQGLAIDEIRRRNKQRPGVTRISENGLHYSWDWGPVHFINLGIVVGQDRNVGRRRRYPPLESLGFLSEDLGRVRDPHQPIVITHHVDVARYCDACDPNAEARNQEWDPCDVRAYYEAIKERNVVALLYGHTHVRNVFRWNGTKERVQQGIPVFNTDNASHFRDKNQAFLYFEIGPEELIAREFATRDAWDTGEWTPQTWRVPIRKRG
ncbi:MAG: metallophosphoesterase [Gemmataceae bacterium]